MSEKKQANLGQDEKRLSRTQVETGFVFSVIVSVSIMLFFVYILLIENLTFSTGVVPYSMCVLVLYGSLVGREQYRDNIEFSVRILRASMLKVVCIPLVVFFVTYPYVTRYSPPTIPSALYGIELNAELNDTHMNALSERGIVWERHDGKDLMDWNYKLKDPMRPESETYVLLGEDNRVIYIRTSLRTEESNTKRLYLDGLIKKYDEMDSDRGWLKHLTLWDYSYYTMTSRMERAKNGYLGVKWKDRERIWNDGKSLLVLSTPPNFGEEMLDVELYNINRVENYLEQKLSQYALTKKDLRLKEEDKVMKRLSRFVDSPVNN